MVYTVFDIARKFVLVLVSLVKVFQFFDTVSP